jgi:hypothetical protein
MRIAAGRRLRESPGPAARKHSGRCPSARRSAARARGKTTASPLGGRPEAAGRVEFMKPRRGEAACGQPRRPGADCDEGRRAPASSSGAAGRAACMGTLRGTGGGGSGFRRLRFKRDTAAAAEKRPPAAASLAPAPRSPIFPPDALRPPSKRASAPGGRQNPHGAGAPGELPGGSSGKPPEEPSGEPSGEPPGEPPGEPSCR